MISQPATKEKKYFIHKKLGFLLTKEYRYLPSSPLGSYSLNLFAHFILERGKNQTDPII